MFFALLLHLADPETLWERRRADWTAAIDDPGRRRTRALSEVSALRRQLLGETDGQTMLPEIDRLLAALSEDPDGRPGGTRRTSGSGVPVVWIPPTPGTVTLGDTRFREDVNPRDQPYPVRLERGFWMMTTEVTQALYVQYRGPLQADGCWTCQTFHGQGFFDPRYPAIAVTWVDAVAFANALSAAEGLTAAYVLGPDPTSPEQVTFAEDADGWRLPTGAEWEWAATGGAPGTVWAGTSDIRSVCAVGNVEDAAGRLLGGVRNIHDVPDLRAASAPFWKHAFHPCFDGFPGLAPVGSFRANAWGLQDMTGNVAEWTTDTFLGPVERSGPATPRGREELSVDRVVRGGAFLASPATTTVTALSRRSADERSHSVGFRLVRSRGVAAR